MKTVFVFFFLCVSHEVIGLKAMYKGFNTLSIEPIDYGVGKNYFHVGIRKSIICKGGDKNDKVEWVDPSGSVVPRVAANRVFVQEHFVPSYKARIPAAVLVFSHLSVEDSGVWQCRTDRKTKDVSLCVLDPVEFVDTPNEVTVDLGRSITLTCQARGEPEPRLVWYRNGELIVDSSTKFMISTKYNSQGFEGLLTIRSLEREDSGIYGCEAIQASPHDDECTTSSSINITLNINYAPIFTNGNDTSVVFVKDNENVELVCLVDAFPEPTYKWYKELGDVLSELSQSEIHVDEDKTKSHVSFNANESLFGQRFRCRATNQYGTVEKVFAIQRLEEPDAPTEVNINNLTHNSLQLAIIWEEEAFYQVGGAEILYMKAEMVKKKASLDWRRAKSVQLSLDEFDSIESEIGGALITLPSLDADTTYWVRVRATNEAGWSAWSAPIKAVTDTEPEVEDTPQEVPVSIRSPTHDSEARFYGLLFAGGVLVVAFGSMFVVRLV
ncbi:limbic system-associated membrane protein-like [Zerene cesonia]|uniref:limbic system-associated membrane protein-like n=1 Tax=Zerene cesonia TaxID=33412 RepID=UPI0018E561CF|nr:limbic system-associated membrane protein-like [Zerene cesonia]